jgi:molybdate transport system ATP-binding protein
MIEVDIEHQLGDFPLSVRFTSNASIVGIFGPSGSGKTSVLNAIAGIAPARGRVRINDTVLLDSAAGINVPAHRRRIGYVFQDTLLFPHMDVASNLSYGLRLRTNADRLIDSDRIVELLGLRPFLHRKPASLSGGEKQRVAIGRALLAQPRIVLMDEPLAALDIARKGEILHYIERLRDTLRIPIVYVSHSIAEITRIADEAAILAHGMCTAVGPVTEVMSHGAPAVRRYEAGTVIDTHVSVHDIVNALTVLEFDGGRLVVPRIDVEVGGRVRARVRARDVSIAVQRPEQISVLNVFGGKVMEIEDVDAAMVDLHLRVGNTSCLARITRRSLNELRIRAGQDVFALVKAVSFDEQSIGYAWQGGGL